MAAVLQNILATKRDEIRAMRAQPLPTSFVPRPVTLKREAHEPLRILAEIKFKSPSAGPLSTALSAADRAKVYERAGASVISVLCDSTYFGGSYEDLTQARRACEIPLLCKEFVLDEIQLDWARAFGADLVLLIARCLGEGELVRLHRAALDRGLTPLVEIATSEEAAWTENLESPIIGVNVRDLDTLTMNAAGARTILDSLDRSQTRLRLSGLKTPLDVSQTRDIGVDGALIGEVLMREANPEPLLRALVGAAAPPVT